MTTTRLNDGAAAGGTMEATTDADARGSAARAQAELIELLAKLVLAAIEAGAAAAHTTRQCGTHERRPRGS
jgi:ATP-dependent exoDNAse (exonuclease V) alpha subunit